MIFPSVPLPFWFLGRVAANTELKVKSALDGRVEVYVPLKSSTKCVSRYCRRRVTYAAPVFPVYVFVRLVEPENLRTAHFFSVHAVLLKEQVAVVKDRTIGAASGGSGRRVQRRYAF